MPRKTIIKKRPYSRQNYDKAASSRRYAYVKSIRAHNPAIRGLQLDSGEFKSVDVTYSLSADTTTSSTLLNGMVLGTSINQHVGREVTMRSIQFKYTVNPTTAASTSDQIVRVLLVYDRQTNAAAATAGQVLEAANVYSPRNLENRKRFSILFDRNHYLNAYGEPGTGTKVFQFYRRLRHPITFNAGTAGNVADIATGSLFVVLIGNLTAGASAATVSFYSRIRYTDN